MNNANYRLQRNDGKTPKDMCTDEALLRLFTKYEQAAPPPHVEEGIIEEEDEDADSGDEASHKK